MKPEIWKRISAAIVLLAPALVIIYDIFADLFGGPTATISAVVRYMAEQWHELPWVVAALFVWLWCHLFGMFVLTVKGH